MTKERKCSCGEVLQKYAKLCSKCLTRKNIEYLENKDEMFGISDCVDAMSKRREGQRFCDGNYNNGDNNQNY